MNATLPRLLLGLKLHTALDQVQAAVILVDGLGLQLRAELVQFHQEPVPDEVQALFLHLVNGRSIEPRQLALGQRLLGECYASAALHAADRAGLSPAHLLAAGLDGLNVWNESDPQGAILVALSAAGVVAERTGVTVVNDFSARDLACQGQGGSLDAVAHWILFRHRDSDRAVLCISEWSEATFLPRSGAIDQTRGGLVGPGMWLLDSLVQQLTRGQERTDAGGRHAVQGRLLPDLLQRWLHHPLLMRRLPRSAHRSIFGHEFARQTIQLAEKQGWSAHDLLCTAHHFVATAAVQSLRQWIGETKECEVILCGTGSRNGFLWRLLEEQAPKWRFIRSDDMGWPTAAVAAASIAILAALALDGEPSNLPTVTGARGRRLLGQMSPGNSANWSACLAWMSGRWENLGRLAA
jgi:anhydro-N-acetylmuramic acid kinase